MKLTIELESDDALSLCSLVKVAMDTIVTDIGKDPLLYSRAARITNEVNEQVIRQITPEEFAKIKERRKADKL